MPRTSRNSSLALQGSTLSLHPRRTDPTDFQPTLPSRPTTAPPAPSRHHPTPEPPSVVQVVSETVTSFVDGWAKKGYARYNPGDSELPWFDGLHSFVKAEGDEDVEEKKDDQPEDVEEKKDDQPEAVEEERKEIATQTISHPLKPTRRKKAKEPAIIQRMPSTAPERAATRAEAAALRAEIAAARAKVLTRDRIHQFRPMPARPPKIAWWKNPEVAAAVVSAATLGEWKEPRKTKAKKKKKPMDSHPKQPIETIAKPVQEPTQSVDINEIGEIPWAYHLNPEQTSTAALRSLGFDVQSSSSEEDEEMKRVTSAYGRDVISHLHKAAMHAKPAQRTPFDVLHPQEHLTLPPESDKDAPPHGINATAASRRKAAGSAILEEPPWIRRDREKQQCDGPLGLEVPPGPHEEWSKGLRRRRDGDRESVLLLESVDAMLGDLRRREKKLLSVKRDNEFELVRGPEPKWYTRKDPGFLSEMSRHEYNSRHPKEAKQRGEYAKQLALAT